MKSKNTFNTLNIVTTAMLAALAVILSTFVHYVSGGSTKIAAYVSPMHFPILLAGILCGQWLGLICGVMAPLISFLTSGRPPFPNGLIPMMFELATYGFFAGLFRKLFLNYTKANKFSSVIALVLAMIAGRITSALSFATIMLISGNPFFINLGEKLLGNFTKTWTAIIAQIVLIPAILFALQKGGILLKYLPDTPTAVKRDEAVAEDGQQAATTVAEDSSEKVDK